MSSSYVIQMFFSQFWCYQHRCKSLRWYEEIKCSVIQLAGPGTAWRNVSLLIEEVQKVRFCDLRNTLVLLEVSYIYCTSFQPMCLMSVLVLSSQFHSTDQSSFCPYLFTSKILQCISCDTSVSCWWILRLYYLLWCNIM